MTRSLRFRRYSTVALAIACLTLVATTAHGNSYTPLAIPSAGLSSTLSGMLPQLAAQRPAELGGVPVAWSAPPTRVFSSNDGLPQLEIPADVSSPLVVHLLVGSRLTWTRHAGRQLGTLRLVFDDGTDQETPLTIGANVREWRPLEGESATVNTASDRHLLEVHRESLSQSLSGRLDKLAVTIDVMHRDKRLASVMVRDELAGVTEPNLMVAAISVERVPQFMTFIRDGEVWIAEGDGTSARRLTTGCQACDHPSLAPGARRVVFVGRDPDTGNLAVRLVGTSGDDTPRTLRDLGPDGVATRPLFTDNGARLLFHRRMAPGRATDVYSLDVGSGTEKRVTTTSASDETNPTPAPDNGDVVYVSRGRVYRRDGRTGKRKVIVRPSRTLSRPDEPAFGPDGKSIVFRAHACHAKQACGVELFMVPRAGGKPRQITTGFGDIASPGFLSDDAIVASAGGAAWSIRASDGSGHLVVDDAVATGTETGDGIQCLQPAQAIVCYHPYRFSRTTPLLGRPDATAAPLSGAVRVGATFAVQSETLPDGCPGAAVAGASERASGAYRWGYVDAPDDPAHGSFGWVAIADLEPAPSATGVCGPDGNDFQCNAAPRACSASRCNGALPTVYPDDIGSEPSCNVAADQYVYASPEVTPLFPGAPSSPLGAPIARITQDTREHFRELWRFSTIGWHCVQFLRSRGAAPEYGWIRDTPTVEGWCGGPMCGDGVKNQDATTEECDDYDDDPCNGCTPQCKLPKCPDGYFCPGKDDQPGFSPAECDEGPASDTCSSICRRPFCGDGLLNYQTINGARVPDQCEDGNSSVNDGCVNCQNARCGDNWLRTDINPATNEPYEECGDEGRVCRSGFQCRDCQCTCSPTPEICGNGVDEDCNGYDDPCPHSCSIYCKDGYGITLPVWSYEDCVYQDRSFCGSGWTSQYACQNHGGQLCISNPTGRCGWSSVFYDGNVVVPHEPAYCCAKCSNRSVYHRASGNYPFHQGQCVAECGAWARNYCAQNGRGSFQGNFVGDCAP